jgi:hypothetical protein
MTALDIPAIGSLGPGWAEKNNANLLAIEERLNRIFDVRVYGAVGDGAVDDTIAINNAVNAAVALGGGTIYFPRGVYLITSAVNLLSLVASPRYNIRLKGDGQFASTIKRTTPGIVIEVAGFYNKIEALGIEGEVLVTAADGGTTSGTKALTSASLTQNYVGALVEGSGIPGGTYIRSVSGSTGTLTANATATASGVALTFRMKGATTGIQVRGHSVNTPTYSPVRSLSIREVYVHGCKEGIRFGHYSTLNGVAGDSGDADIAGDSYSDIWIDNCDYPWIEDGQNVLLNQVTNLWTTGATYHHTYQPRGGQVHIETGFFAWSVAAPATTIASGSNGAVLPQATINVASISGVTWPAVGTVTVTTSAGPQQVSYQGITGTTLTGCIGGTGTMSTGGAVVSNGFPKCWTGSWNAFFKDCRSENATGTEPPVVVTAPGNGTAQITEEGCYWTNNVGVGNIDEMILGSTLFKTNCTTTGAVAMQNTTYAGLGNDIQGGYLRYGNQPSKQEVIYDKGFSRVSSALGNLRFGFSPNTVAYSPAANVTLGGTGDSPVALIGDLAPTIQFHLTGSAVQRAGIYMFGTGTDGGLLGFSTKPSGGSRRDVAALLDTFGSGATALMVLCNVGGVFTLQPVTLGAADSGGTGYKALRVPNS